MEDKVCISQEQFNYVIELLETAIEDGDIGCIREALYILEIEESGFDEIIDDVDF